MPLDPPNPLDPSHLIAPAVPRPAAVVMMDDEDLLDDVVRLAAATGSCLERVPDPAALRLRWESAALVLLDEACARAAATMRLARRDGVLLLHRNDPPSSLWERAVAVGAEHMVSLPEAGQWLAASLVDTRDAGADGIGRVGRVVSVIGGRGGAGASTLAAAIAVHAGNPARSTRALLVDCDPKVSRQTSSRAS